MAASMRTWRSDHRDGDIVGRVGEHGSLEGGSCLEDRYGERAGTGDTHPTVDVFVLEAGAQSRERDGPFIVQAEGRDACDMMAGEFCRDS